MLKKSLLLSALFIINYAFADDSPEAKALKKNMPADVAVVLDRIIQCNRWGGEEPASKERAVKVKAELEKWQCDALAKDKDEIIKRYQYNYEVKARIQDAQYVLL